MNDRITEWVRPPAARSAHSPGSIRRMLHALALTWVAVLPVASAQVAGASTEPKGLLLDAAMTREVIVLVGERGTILRSTDHAQSFTAIATPTRATLTGISFAGAAGWAVGHDALILGTLDGGLTWKQHFQGKNLQDSFLDVIALDARRVIAVGAYGLCVVSTDGGTTWSTRKPSEDDCHFNRISRGTTGTLYLAGERGTLLRSKDTGETWTPIPAPYEGSFYGIVPVAENILLAYGLRGHVYRSSDDGDTWAAIATPAPALLATGAQLNETTIVLAGQARTLLVSRDGGLSFANALRAPVGAIARLLPLAEDRLLAVGENGRAIISLAP